VMGILRAVLDPLIASKRARDQSPASGRSA